MLQLLRRDFWRYVRAGVVVGLATAAGLVLLIVPGVLVAIATPVVIRRVTCQEEAAVPALIAALKSDNSDVRGEAEQWLTRLESYFEKEERWGKLAEPMKTK